MARGGRVQMVTEPGDRDAAAVRCTDKLLALYDARLEQGTAGLAEWLRASPLPGADETTRVLILMRVNRIVDVAERQRCRDLLR